MTERSLFILGRQASIGIAELESLYGHEVLTPAGNQCVVGSISASEVTFSRIGSSVKLGTYLGVIPGSRWLDVKAELPKFVLQCAEKINEGKIQLGISAYGFNITSSQLMATGLGVKKQLRKHAYSTRLVPNKEETLNSAQVLHNNLTGERGIELLIVKNGHQTIVGRTVDVQDINAYAARDQGRPKRDAFVGMLPPKLAQTIINLAVGQSRPESHYIILDPFCGTGVILQEALLMGYGAYGSDLEARMIDYSRQNLEWLTTTASTTDPMLETGDATMHQWQHPFSTVASEVYLGHPLSSWPSSDKLAAIVGSCNLITSKFLQNIAKQIPEKTQICLAVPAWINPNDGIIRHLPMLDHLDVLGYNRVSFHRVSASDLLYYRPGQLVGRELLVLTRRSKESK